MLCIPRSLRTAALPIQRLYPRFISKLPHETDEYGLPVRPTWSVNELLSSYPSPEISPATLKRLHELSALIPPEEGSTEHIRITQEIQEMVRLVEAVKLVDTTGTGVTGRVEREDADRHRKIEPIKSEESGQVLFKHAARTRDGFYVVDTERKQ